MIAKPTNSISIEKLTTAIEDMRDIADGAFSRISGIAKCMLAALESNYGAADTEALADALQSIILDANMSKNDIGNFSENVGIKNELCPRWLKRFNATPSNAKTAQGGF